MSKVRKAKKLRTPNVPLYTGPGTPEARPAANEPEAFSTEGLPEFDYTAIRRDLARIGILAATFIAILIALAFVLPSYLQ